MDAVTFWNTVKRYIAGAVVGVVVSVAVSLGIIEVASPDLLERIEVVIDGVLTGVFYVVTITYARWRQKKMMDAGKVLPERVESAAVAAEHGVPVK